MFILQLTLRKIILASALPLLFVFFSSHVHAADIALSPSSGSYKVGSTVSVSVLLTNNQEAINAVSAGISFTRDILELQSVSKSGSILSLWAEEPSFSNDTGRVSFEGGVTNPGFAGSQGRIVTLSFKVKKQGQGSLTINSGSVLANDGNATNVLRSLGSASFTITEAEPVVIQAPTSAPTVQSPTVTSSSYPDLSKWYSSRDASFEWSVPSSVTAVRTLYDENASSVPTKVYEDPISKKTFTVEEDGTFYMHVQFRTAGGWGTVAHRKFQIDSVPPKVVRVTFEGGEVTTNSSPTIRVDATDDLSGLDRIAIQVDGGEGIEYPVAISNTYRLSKLSPGKHTVTVTVFDKASNQAKATAEVTIEKLDMPVITSYTKRVEQGGEVSVVGTAQPGVNVEVSLVNEDDKVVSNTVTANENGDFTSIQTYDISSGVYELSVKAVDNIGAVSESTESRLVVVEDIKLIRIGMFIMNWLSLALIIILASALVVATFWYSFLQFTRFRRKIRRTMKEAEDTLRTNVQALRRDTEEFHTILVKAEKKRNLTKEEQAILKKFKKRLDITEKEIEKKLEQIQ